METATETSNPYNADKHWHDTKETPERGFISANDALAEPEVTQDASPTPPEKATQEEKKYKRVNWKKRHDDLRRYQNKKEAEYKAKIEALEKGTEPAYKLPKTPEELATFREENPDMYGTIESVAHQIAQQQVEEMNTKLKTFEEREQQLIKEEAVTAVRKEHPEFDELQSSPVFHKWLQDQPQELQNWIYKSLDPKLASKVITLFKREVDYSSSTPAPRADPTAAVNTKASGSRSMEKGEKIWTTSEIQALTVQEYDRLSKDIDKAYTEGRVVKG